MLSLRLPGLLLALSGCHALFPLGGYAGGADAGPRDGGPTPGTCEGAFLCDGFESGTGGWSLVQQQNGGTVTVDSAHAHRGTQALHVTAQAAGGESFAQLRQVDAVPRRFYARVFVYQPSPAASGPAAFIAAQESGGAFRGTSLSLATGRPALTNWGGSPDQYLEAPSALPTDRWVCVEWMLDGVAAATRTWVDGVEVAELHGTGLATPPYGWFRLGLDVVVTPGVRYELWLDDLYVGEQPVGCDQ